MKKISTILFIILFAAVAVNAQEFKKFRWNLGMGYAIPGGSGAKGGILIHSEPTYRVSDQILVGLRMEFAGMVRGYSDGVASEASVSFAGSYSLTGQYYFSNNSFRPFVGLGVGTYALASVSGNITSEDNAYYYAGASGSKIGFFPRVGFDAGHFNLQLEYNLVGKTEMEAFDASTGLPDASKNIDQKNGYIGVKLGVFIGGGRK